MRETWEVAGLFLKLGLTAFGGPAVHIAMMRREVVERRKWLSEEAFLDLVGATNLIPGPNSTEMAIHIGFLRAGWPGFLLAGLAFILPAMFMVSALAWFYVRSGTLPQVAWPLYGIKPVVVALIVHAVVNLGRAALKGTPEKLGFLAVLALYLWGANEIALLFGGGLLLCLRGGTEAGGAAPKRSFLPWAGIALAGAGAAPFTLPSLFLKFLKIGSILYGSGYVLLPFLRAEFLESSGWLSENQILDAVSIGQITPGPFFTTATFIGHILGGVSGGLLATLGIFLPAFVFVAVSNPLIPKLRSRAWVGRLLDGVNVSSLALMAGAAWQTGKASVVDGPTLAVFLGAGFMLFRKNASSTLLVAGGGAIGIIAHLAA